MSILFVLLGLSLFGYTGYRGYKYGQTKGHKWIGLIVGLLLWAFIVGPIFWWVLSKVGVIKPATGVGSGTP